LPWKSRLAHMRSSGMSAFAPPLGRKWTAVLCRPRFCGPADLRSERPQDLRDLAAVPWWLKTSARSAAQSLIAALDQALAQHSRAFEPRTSLEIAKLYFAIFEEAADHLLGGVGARQCPR
jgi:hypothetical protein